MMEEMRDKCPTCGAAIDQACVFDAEAFCMECGEIFTLWKSEGNDGNNNK